MNPYALKQPPPIVPKCLENHQQCGLEDWFLAASFFKPEFQLKMINSTFGQRLRQAGFGIFQGYPVPYRMKLIHLAFVKK